MYFQYHFFKHPVYIFLLANTQFPYTGYKNPLTWVVVLSKSDHWLPRCNYVTFPVQRKAFFVESAFQHISLLVIASRYVLTFLIFSSETHPTSGWCVVDLVTVTFHHIRGTRRETLTNKRVSFLTIPTYFALKLFNPFIKMEGKLVPTLCVIFLFHKEVIVRGIRQLSSRRQNRSQQPLSLGSG